MKTNSRRNETQKKTWEMRVIIHLRKFYRPHLLTKKLKVHTYSSETIILPVVLYGCET